MSLLGAWRRSWGRKPASAQESPRAALPIAVARPRMAKSRAVLQCKSEKSPPCISDSAAATEARPVIRRATPECWLSVHSPPAPTGLLSPPCPLGSNLQRPTEQPLFPCTQHGTALDSPHQLQIMCLLLHFSQISTLYSLNNAPFHSIRSYIHAT
ncbi:hypothetical protein IQ07DRAFT_661473 [Pyrenochaeta sp. DS3sAY3a]|nr:hypothetical protein IQ07DRAFT_661473 [Pyrenochaeta sp. DS3sAY3a]